MLFPMPITHPLASLLEPLVSNALCKEDDQLLRKVIDRFGRKTTNLPHMENEGIGCSGEISLAMCIFVYSICQKKLTISLSYWLNRCGVRYAYLEKETLCSRALV